MVARSTNAEVLKRKEAVKEMLADGYSRGQILQFTEEQWGISESMTDKYIAMCNEEFEQMYREKAEKRYGRAVERTYKFYRKMKMKGNDVCAISALKELNDLEGVKLVSPESDQEIKIIISKTEADL